MEIIQECLNRFISAVSSVGENYFELPVFGAEPLHRERNFCAELFHRLRITLEGIGYLPSFEPDKRGHPIIERECGKINPDILIHRPGQMGMEDNLCVIEVKSADGDLKDGLLKDIRTINCMTSIEGGYAFAIFLIFGKLDANNIESILDRIVSYRVKNDKPYYLILIQEAHDKPKIYLL